MESSKEQYKPWKCEVQPQDTAHLIQRPCYQRESPCHPAGKRTTENLTIVKRRTLQWYGHVSRSSGLAKTILQGTVKGGRRQGGQRKRWEDIREWTGLEFGKSQRAVENRVKWRILVAKSSVVPQRPSRLKDRWWWWRNEGTVLTKNTGNYTCRVVTFYIPKQNSVYPFTGTLKLRQGKVLTKNVWKKNTPGSAITFYVLKQNSVIYVQEPWNFVGAMSLECPSHKALTLKAYSSACWRHSDSMTILLFIISYSAQAGSTTETEIREFHMINLLFVISNSRTRWFNYWNCMGILRQICSSSSRKLCALARLLKQ